jgi:hypothetical protein
MRTGALKVRSSLCMRYDVNWATFNSSVGPGRRFLYFLLHHMPPAFQTQFLSIQVPASSPPFSHRATATRRPRPHSCSSTSTPTCRLSHLQCPKDVRPVRDVLEKMARPIPRIEPARQTRIDCLRPNYQRWSAPVVRFCSARRVSPGGCF